MVVSLDVTVIAPALGLVRSSRDGAPYLGRYDVQMLADDSTITRRRLQVDILESGDTLRWRDADGPESERPDFLLSPAGKDEFTPARRAPDGQYWADSASVVRFNVKSGRASRFAVQQRDGGTTSRGTRTR